VLCVVVVGVVLVVEETVILLTWASRNKLSTRQLEAMIPQEVNIKVCHDVYHIGSWRSYREMSEDHRAAIEHLSLWLGYCMLVGLAKGIVCRWFAEQYVADLLCRDPLEMS
jgi:hypothetical protein